MLFLMQNIFLNLINVGFTDAECRIPNLPLHFTETSGIVPSAAKALDTTHKIGYALILWHIAKDVHMITGSVYGNGLATALIDDSTYITSDF